MNKQTQPAITNIFKTNLNVKKHEKILVFTDNHNKNLTKISRLIAKEGILHTTNLIFAEYIATEIHGAEPPETLWLSSFGKKTIHALKSNRLLKPLLSKITNKKQEEKIENIVRTFKKEAVNAVIALSHYSTSHTKFRDLLTNVCGTRYASMPLFDKKMLSGAMGVDWNTMEKRTKKIMKKINRYRDIEITTRNGTYITFSKKGRNAQADTGVITKKGSFSNLPAGEVYLAPCEGTSNGRLVLEWAPTRKLKNPITLFVQKGTVREIQGKEEYTKHLRAKISERAENANIAELGIGTNDKASRPDNILESEKILGTIHIALGDNSSFGGRIRTPFHQDFIFFKPTLTLFNKKREKEILILDGKLL